MAPTTVNDLAQELLDAVIDEVGKLTHATATHSMRKIGTETLKSCSLVAWTWLPRTRYHLFHEVEFGSMDCFSRWKADISHGETSPYGFVQALRFREKTEEWITHETFSQILTHMVAFPKVENLIFTQYDITPLVLPLQRTSVPTFIESVRYLEVSSTAMDTPNELLALIDCFPHLEDLNLGHGRVRRFHEKGAYPQRAVERLRGRLYIGGSEREGDTFLREFATRPIRFQEVRVAECLFRQPLSDVVAVCAPTLKRLQVLAPSRNAGTVDSLLEQFPPDQPFVDLSSFARLQHLRLSTRDLDTLDDWILPILHTIVNVPEELTIHEARMRNCYGIGLSGWEEVETCLEALAIKAAERGHRLRLVLTMGVFRSPRSEPKFPLKLNSFTERGTFTVLPSSLTHSSARAPF